MESGRASRREENEPTSRDWDCLDLVSRSPTVRNFGPGVFYPPILVGGEVNLAKIN